MSLLPESGNDDARHVPWHRIRQANGHLKSGQQREITSAHDLANRMFIAERGKLHHGAATPLCRYPTAKLRSIAIAAGVIRDQMITATSTREQTLEYVLRLRNVIG